MHLRIAGVAVLAGLAVSTAVIMAGQTSVAYSVVDLLVWGAELQIDSSRYPLEVRAAIDRHRERWNAHRPSREPPVPANEMALLVEAQVRYERRLVAVTDDSRARSLAIEYADQLKPCYEWEGDAGCPEREAAFAMKYLASHPDGPFREYLPLLAAHRWLCAADAYGLVSQSEAAARSRRTAADLLVRARRSPDVLVRTAAEELTARGHCH